jgi:hypothetical protein
MSNHNQPPKYRPMIASPGNIDSIKKQFAAKQSEGIIVQSNADGTDKAPPPQDPAEIKFYPFADSGNILAWVASATKVGDYFLVVNIEPDPEREPRPSVIALCRQPSAAQMLTDGVNFLFKCQQQMEGAAKLADILESESAGTQVPGELRGETPKSTEPQ